MPRSRSSFCTIRHDRLGAYGLRCCLLVRVPSSRCCYACHESGSPRRLRLDIVDWTLSRRTVLRLIVVLASFPVLNQVARCCLKAQHLSQRRAACHSVPTKRTDGRRQPDAIKGPQLSYRGLLRRLAAGCVTVGLGASQISRLPGGRLYFGSLRLLDNVATMYFRTLGMLARFQVM
jgi:hypothetical protein